MESIDTSKITIKESGLSAYDSTYLPLLKENGIYYMSQVLDDELMNSLFLKLRRDAVRTRDLKGFISLAKYKYLNVIDPAIEVLDERFFSDLTKNNFSINSNLPLLVELGIASGDDISICRNLRNCAQYDSSKQYTIAEILRMVYPLLLSESKGKHRRIAFNIQLLLEQYDKTKLNQIGEGTVEELMELKGQLSSLMVERNSIDKLIADVQAKIALIEKAKENGGIKK